MQEHPTTQFINTSFLRCIQNKPAVFLCTTKPCQNCALLCGEETCKCFEEEHPNCDFSNLKRLYKRILSKKVNTEQSLNKAFTAIDRLFSDAIDTLSHERDKYVLIKQNYGLSIEQVKFLQYLTTNNKEQLTGNFISKIQYTSKEHSMESLLTEQRVNGFWKKNKAKLDDILNKITTLVAYSSDANSRKVKQLEWDAEMKIGGIEIRESSVIRVMKVAMQPITVVEPLNKQNPSIWAFRIKKMISSVGVGVCNRKAKYNLQKVFGQQNYQGLSMVLSDGKSTDNMRLGNNGMPLPTHNTLFSFRSGDIIYMKVNYGSKSIQFNKNLSSLNTTVKLDLQIEYEDLYPACILAAVGEEIQIVDITQEDQEKLNKLFLNPQPSSTIGGMFTNKSPVPFNVL